jgi:hypothetical protein
MKIITQTIVLIMADLGGRVAMLFDNFNRRALRCFNLQLL